MPYLKNKVNISRKSTITEVLSEDEENIVTPVKISEPKAKKEKENERTQKTPKQQQTQKAAKVKRDQSKPSSKNIVKNFGKAMCSFASSDLALPYLDQINAKKGVNLEQFQDHIHKKRDLIDSIDSLRTLLLITKHDDEAMMGFKKLFQEISIIFIKYFSVNWIFQGKMSHKQAHLRSRFKMLRRIKSPQHFTYFKDFSR